MPIIDPSGDTPSAAGLVVSGVGYDPTYHEEYRSNDVSTTRSSPSSYPPSLPPFGDDDNTIDAPQSPNSDDSFNVSHSPIPPEVPPRPPRSPLRRSITMSPEMYTMTPPSSVSSDTPPRSPILLDEAKVVNRRTLLNVRTHVIPCNAIVLTNQTFMQVQTRASANDNLV